MRVRGLPTSTAAILCALVIGCSSSGNSPSTVSPAAPSSSATLDTFVGSWTSPFVTGANVGGTGGTLPGCSDLRYDINKATDDKSATVTFNATCAGITIAGTGSGSLAGSTLTWSTSGTVSRGTQSCSFDFKDNTATPEGANAIRVNYAGTVCGVPVNGSQVFTRK